MGAELSEEAAAVFVTCWGGVAYWRRPGYARRGRLVFCAYDHAGASAWPGRCPRSGQPRALAGRRAPSPYQPGSV
jgi:hypothetical protein